MNFMHEVFMTGLGYRGRHGHARFPAVLSAVGFIRWATIAALLAVIASILPGALAAQAQTPPQTLTRRSLVTVDNGRVYHRLALGSWRDLGAPDGVELVETAMVSDGLGRLNIIATGGYGGLWQNTFNGNWSGWLRVPGQILVHTTDGDRQEVCVASVCYYPQGYRPSVAVASWGPGHMDLFMVAFAVADGPDGHGALLHTSADNYVWSGTWDVIDTNLAPGTNGIGSIEAVSWGSGRIDAFVTSSTDSSVWHRIYSTGAWWSSWEQFFLMTSVTNLAAASPGGGRLNLGMRGADGFMWSLLYSGGWFAGIKSDFCCLAYLDVLKPISADSVTHDTVDVFMIGTDHALYRKTWSATDNAWQGTVLVDNAHHYTNITVTAWTDLVSDQP